jgi:hypothetical protein
MLWFYLKKKYSIERPYALKKFIYMKKFFKNWMQQYIKTKYIQSKKKDIN